MLRVNIIAVGKLKESYWRGAEAEYIKRLGASCKAQVVELAESRLPSEPSQKEIERALAAEAALMQPYIETRGAYNIALCIEGRELSSEQLSGAISDCAVHGYSTVNLIIGSSFGLDEGVKRACALRVSMSRLTFPHQLARVMLLEQLYRAFQIAEHTRYHK